MKPGGPRFESSVLLLAEFLLGISAFNSQSVSLHSCGIFNMFQVCLQNFLFCNTVSSHLTL